MDAIIELSRQMGFRYPEEIIKTLNIGNCKCDFDFEKILNLPPLPPLSYTNDCLRFVALLKHCNGIHIARECARAYRKIIRGSLKEKEDFWWGLQELLYKVKADIKVIRRYLRRLKKDYRKIMKAKSRIEKITTAWILPPYVDLFAGLLPPRLAVKAIKFAIECLVQKSGYFARFNVSVFELAFELFNGMYKIALTNLVPRDKFKMMIDFTKFYIGSIEILLICGKDSIDPPLNLPFWKNSD